MTHTIAEAEKIMRETQRLLDKDARAGRRANAMASSRAKPPSATQLFLDFVVDRQDEDGLTLPEAIREGAIQKPTLHAAWLAETNAERQREQRGKLDVANENRRRRNRQ